MEFSSLQIKFSYFLVTDTLWYPLSIFIFKNKHECCYRRISVVDQRNLVIARKNIESTQYILCVITLILEEMCVLFQTMFWFTFGYRQTHFISILLAFESVIEIQFLNLVECLFLVKKSFHDNNILYFCRQMRDLDIISGKKGR